MRRSKRSPSSPAPAQLDVGVHQASPGGAGPKETSSHAGPPGPPDPGPAAMTSRKGRVPSRPPRGKYEDLIVVEER